MASACEFPEELIVKPLGYVAVTGLDIVHNAMHKSIWETFTVSRRQEKVLNIQLIPGDKEFPKRKQKQRTSYEFYVPKGILKENWMKKHLHRLPALVVVFYDLDWKDIQWKEKQTECASRVSVIRSSLAGRSTRIAVVLIQKNMPHPPGEDPQAMQRAESLCQACELPSKSLFVLPYSDHLHGYVTRLEAAFYEIAQTHYGNEARFIKQHKDLLNKSQHQLLFVRHQFKVAFYNEMKQDIQAALKHYKQAYQHILEHRMTDISNLEVKLVAGFLNYKICRISFQSNAPLDAISQFRKHIDYFKSKIGPSNLAFEHYAWMAKQFSLFGDLFQEAIKNGLNAIQTQHPGFYYQQAANHSMIRMKQSKILCRYSEPVQPNPLEDLKNLEFYGQRPWRQGCQANEAPDPTMEQAGVLSLQALELNVEHVWIIIPLLSSAVAQFREYKSVRMKLFLMVQMGEEYFNAGDYLKALTLFNRVSPHYRGERWWKLLTSVLCTALRCAYLTTNVQDYITIALELIGEKCCCIISKEEKIRIQTNLSKVFKGEVPEAENNCAVESVETAQTQWTDSLSTVESTFTVDMENLASFIECRACFDADVYTLNEQAAVTLYLRCVAPLPLEVTELGLQFTNQAYNASCIKSECDELTLNPDQIHVYKFQFNLSPTDVSKTLEIKQIYLRFGEHVILRWKGAGLDANLDSSYDVVNYGGERLPVKYNQDGAILWQSVASFPCTDIQPRPAKLLLNINHNQPYLVDEFYLFAVTVDNKETTKITNARLLVKLVNETAEQQEQEGNNETQQKATLYLDELDGGDGQSGLNQVRFDLDELEPEAVVSKNIYLRSSEMGENKVSFEESVLTVETQMPFSIAAKVANMKFKQIKSIHVDEPFTIMTYVRCTSPWPVDIITSEFLLSPDFQAVDATITSQVEGLKLKQSNVAGECQCIVAPMKSQDLNIGTTKTSSIGHYILHWKRSSGGREICTKVNLPNANIDFLPFYIKTELPSYGRVQEAMLCKYTVYNRTSLVQEVEAAVEPSEAFMLAGSTQVQFRILPNGEHTLHYSMYPLSCGELPLPKLHINLPQHYNINSDQMAKQMLTTHIYVQPKEISLKQDIKVV